MIIEKVKVTDKLPLQEGVSSNGNPWKTQAYIVQGEGQYDRPICVECFGRKADEIVLEVGQLVTLNVDVESRNVNGRWYTSVRVFRVDQPQQAAAPVTPTTAPAPAPAPAPAQTQAPAAAAPQYASEAAPYTPPAAPAAPVNVSQSLPGENTGLPF